MSTQTDQINLIPCGVAEDLAVWLSFNDCVLNLAPEMCFGRNRSLQASRSLVIGALTTERERRIVVLRFGLEDGRFRTLEEVGREFGITRERIRQIEAVALRKLRHPHLGKKLRGYLD